MWLLIFFVLGGYLLVGHAHAERRNSPNRGNVTNIGNINGPYSGEEPYGGKGYYSGNGGNRPIHENYPYPRIGYYTDPVLYNIKFGHIYGPLTSNNITLPMANGAAVNLIDNKWFDIRKPTICYMHGFNGNVNDMYVQSVAKAILWHGGYNFLFLDWSQKTSQQNTFAYYEGVAAPATPILAPFIAQLFIQWFDKGLCVNTFHLIGQCLGAQLGGLIGYEIQRQSNDMYILERLTGLDPARRLWFPPKQRFRHVKPTDAKFVDIYHTNSRMLGAPIDVGDCDFWFNSPYLPQPGCDIAAFNTTEQNFCSSVRSILLYVGSITCQNMFEVIYCIKAKSWEAFVAGHYDINDIAIAGFVTPSNTRGRYWCTTTSNVTHLSKGWKWLHPSRD